MPIPVILLLSVSSLCVRNLIYLALIYCIYSHCAMTWDKLFTPIVFEEDGRKTPLLFISFVSGAKADWTCIVGENSSCNGLS